MVSDCYDIVWNGAHGGVNADLFRRPEYQREQTPFIPESHGQRIKPMTQAVRNRAVEAVLTYEWQGVALIGTKAGVSRESARRALIAMEDAGLAESMVGRCLGTPRLYRRKA